MRFLLILVLVLSACTTRTMVLAEEFRPLKFLSENPILCIGLKVGGCWTCGDTVYCKDLAGFLAARPEPEFSSGMAHERAHAIREFAYPGGVILFLLRYSLDREFAMEEEKAAYIAEAQYATMQGQYVDPIGIAYVLDTYWNLGGDFTSYEDALAWAKEQELNGWRN